MLHLVGLLAVTGPAPLTKQAGEAYTHTFTAAGNYSVEPTITYTNAEGSSDSAKATPTKVAVTVKPDSCAAPSGTLSATASTTTVGQSATFKLSLGDAANRCTITSITWRVTGPAPSATDGGASFTSYTHAFGRAGEYAVGPTITYTTVGGSQATVKPNPETLPVTVRATTRIVNIVGEVYILDHEIFSPDESGRFAVDETRTVSPADRVATVSWNACVGDEVEVVINLTIALESDDTSVTLRGDARLYEETSCSNDDLEDTRSLGFLLGAGNEQFERFRLNNVGEGGDYADVNLVISNDE